MQTRQTWLATWLLLIASGGLTAQEPYINSVFPIAPREMRQHLSRAETAVTEERFSDAVFEIGEILNSAEGDDFFVGSPGSVDAQVSLKTQALALKTGRPAILVRPSEDVLTAFSRIAGGRIESAADAEGAMRIARELLAAEAAARKPRP